MLKRIIAAWDHFWFSPCSPASICVFRILVGIQVLLCALFWAPRLLTWFGEKGVESAQAVNLCYGSPRFDLLILFGSNDTITICLYLALIIAALCLTVGLFSRSSALIVWLLLLSFHNRNFFILNAGDHLLRVCTFLLFFAPAGKMYSVDSWIKKKANNAASNITCEPWVQRLFQILLCTIYYEAFTIKLTGRNWLSGTAVYYVLHCKEFQRFHFLQLFNQPMVYQFLNWATLGIEFSLFSLIWIKELRYWVLLCGLIFHLGIECTMVFGLFEYATVSLYVNFINPRIIERLCSQISRFLMKIPLSNTIQF
jgi:hypothetical protein